MIAVFLIAAILFIRLNLSVNPLGFILFSLLLAGIVALIIISFIKKWARFKSVTFILALVVCLAAGLQFYFNTIRDDYACPDTLHFVSGKVDDITMQNHRFILNDLRINGERQSGRMRVYADFYTNPELYSVSVGDYIIFRANLRANRLVRYDGSINAHAPRTGIRYRVFDFYDDIVAIEPGEPTFFGGLQEQMKENLTLAMGSEYGNIAFGMLTGDRSDVAFEVRDAYSASGLMHIMAVSGLHVGFLSFGLFKLFSLIKIPKKIGNFAVIGVLFFYAFFVGFSAPIVRAVVMATIMILAYTFSKRYDSLNALCMAMTAILVFAPFFLFDVGFLFSMGALGGITFFMRPINGFLKKIKLPNFLARNIAMSASAQIGIIPAMIYFFNSVQIYSIFTNMLVHPILHVGFSAIFVSLLLTMLWQGFSVLLQLSGIFIALIDGIVMGVSSFPGALFFVLPAFGVLLFLCYLFYFVASRFFMLPRRGLGQKIRTGVACLIAVVFAFIGVPLTRFTPSTTFIAPVNTFRAVDSVVRLDDRVYIIGDFINFIALDNTLRRLNITRIDAIFLSELNAQSASTLIRFSGRYRFGKVKTAYDAMCLDALTQLASGGVNNFFAFCGTYALTDNVLAIMQGDRLLGYELLTQNGSIIFSAGRRNYALKPPEVLARSFAIRTFSYSGYKSDRIFLTNVPYRRFGEPLPPPQNQLDSASLGSFLFDFMQGSIYSFDRDRIYLWDWD